MEGKKKLRLEYRENVGSTFNKTWEWYAEWLEQELLKARSEALNIDNVDSRRELFFCKHKLVLDCKEQCYKCKTLSGS